ncbi:MAG TPA: hypothetical protein VLA33_08420 [Gemmatimonadota bacterium]|nr:hypothetical protein [Gemmatimonadota bacterium]
MRRSRSARLISTGTAVSAFGVLLLAVACGRGFPPPELEPFEPLPEPDPAHVERVLFLVGDAGATDAARSPLLVQLGRDVERWSAALGRDSAVAIAFLGDNVYPHGLRDRTHPGFAADSARLWNQVALLSGPTALEHRTVGWFLAGNHDWGGMVGPDGVKRLRNQEDAIERMRNHGRPGAAPTVEMIPAAGNPGPVVHDLGPNLRFVFIDTHWFLQDPAEAEQRAFFDELRDAFTAAGDREIVVLSHHPWETSGPHGVSEGGRALGLYYLLEKSGSLVQDLSSPVYADFIGAFREVVRVAGRRPLVFAAGHDHSLQVFEALEATDPLFGLVSGAGSKLSPVSRADGLKYAATRPGYMTLVFRRDGGVDLFVTAGSARRRLCPAGPEAARASCMRDGVAAFDTVYSTVVREPDREDRRTP